MSDQVEKIPYSIAAADVGFDMKSQLLPNHRDKRDEQIGFSIRFRANCRKLFPLKRVV